MSLGHSRETNVENGASTRLVASWHLFRLISGAIIFAVAWPASQQLEYERSVESLFPPGDVMVRDFQAFQRTFGSSQIAMVVYPCGDLFDPQGQTLAQVRSLAEELRKGPGISDVFSAATLDEVLRRWGSSIFKKDIIAQQCRRTFEGFTHSADGRVVAVACVLDEAYIAQHGRRPTMNFLRQFVDRHAADVGPMMLVGEPVMVSESFRLLENDSRRLSIITTILLGITILATVRSIRWALISMLVVQWTLVVTTALLYLAGLKLSMVSSMFAAVVTVVAVATVMHLAVGYQRRLTPGVSPYQAWRDTWRDLAAPVAWACITDAVGFAALRVAAVGPVRDFGLMMAIGSLMVWVATIWIVPPMVTLAARPVAVTVLERGWLPNLLSRLGGLATQRAVLTFGTIGLLTGISAVGNARLEIESDFTKNFRADSAIAQAYNFVEGHFGGAGVWDISIPAPIVINKPFLERVLGLEKRLREMIDPETGQPAFSKVLSLADLIDAARQQKLLAYVPTEFHLRALELLAPKIYSSFRATDPESGRPVWRIMLRAYDRRRAATKMALINQVRRLAEETFPPRDNEPAVRVTGFYVLLTHLISGVVRDQWRCFAAAVLGVGLCMVIALRHWGAVFAALVTNVLPIVLALGVLGWAGIHLNMGAAMMAAVSMGLAVDSSLHYLYVYLRARRHHAPPQEALHQAQRTVGRALVYATVALALGFASLATSDFMPTVYFGILAGVTLAGSLAGNLLVLPALLALGQQTARWFTRESTAK